MTLPSILVMRRLHISRVLCKYLLPIVSFLILTFCYPPILKASVLFSAAAIAFQYLHSIYPESNIDDLVLKNVHIHTRVCHCITFLPCMKLPMEKSSFRDCELLHFFAGNEYERNAISKVQRRWYVSIDFITYTICRLSRTDVRSSYSFRVLQDGKLT
jgi:hypothetical protein